MSDIYCRPSTNYNYDYTGFPVYVKHFFKKTKKDRGILLRSLFFSSNSCHSCQIYIIYTRKCFPIHIRNCVYQMKTGILKTSFLEVAGTSIPAYMHKIQTYACCLSCGDYPATPAEVSLLKSGLIAPVLLIISHLRTRSRLTTIRTFRL